MKLPAGRQASVVIDPRKENTVRYLKTFRGAIEIDSNRGKGFILMRDGNLIAAYFKDKEDVFRGDDAARYIMRMPSSDGSNQQNFIMRTYNEKDYSEALELCRTGELFLGSDQQSDESSKVVSATPDGSRHAYPLLDETILNKLMSQPGVIAVSAFYEGFPVLSKGEADFEHVAARAEDFLRTGTKIAQDMNLGECGQLILETVEHKFIIVPCGDLFLCIITRADAQLGLMRVLIRSIQNEVENEG